MADLVDKAKSWSKYGGARFAVKEPIDEFWVCQFCGQKQTKNMPRWIVAFERKSDVFRICSSCRHAYLHVAVRKVFDDLFELISEIRRFNRDVENSRRDDS